MSNIDGAGRIAWITGAGSGIGRALALRLARDGWRVMISARSGDDLAEVAGQAPGIYSYRLDVMERPAVEETVRRIEAEHGPIALAVLAAGTYKPVSGKEFSADAFGANVAVNLNGTANCLEVLIPVLSARRAGHIAVVSSLTGYVGLPTASGYGATKAALINMCEALEPELEPVGVKISVINPGFVKTPLTDKNEFPMPFLITAEDAADRIAKGLAAGKFEIAFPLRMTIAIKLLAALPHGLRLMLTRRMLPR